jgi:hypothetical protein
MLLGQIDVDTARKLMTEQNYTVAGVVLVILFLVGLAVWRVLSWTGSQIFIPARDKMFAHLDVVNETMKDGSEMLRKLSEMPARLGSIESKVDGLTERVDDIDSHLREIGTKPTRRST